MAGTQGTQAKDARETKAGAESMDAPVELAGASTASEAPEAEEQAEAPETFRVVNGTLLHDGRAYPAGAEFRCGDAETVRALRACRAIALPEEALETRVAQASDENTALRERVRDLERQIAEARASIERRERVM